MPPHGAHHKHNHKSEREQAQERARHRLPTHLKNHPRPTRQNPEKPRKSCRQEMAQDTPTGSQPAPKPNTPPTAPQPHSTAPTHHNSPRTHHSPHTAPQHPHAHAHTPARGYLTRTAQPRNRPRKRRKPPAHPEEQTRGLRPRYLRRVKTTNTHMTTAGTPAESTIGRRSDETNDSPSTTVEPDEPDEAETETDQLAPLGALCGLTQVTPLSDAIVKHHNPPHSCAHSHGHS